MVANGTLYRNYDFPEISNALLTTAYRDAFTSRGHGTPALRVAQNLLAFAGGPIRSNDPVVQRAVQELTGGQRPY